MKKEDLMPHLSTIVCSYISHYYLSNIQRAQHMTPCDLQDVITETYKTLDGLGEHECEDIKPLDVDPKFMYIPTAGTLDPIKSFEIAPVENELTLWDQNVLSAPYEEDGSYYDSENKDGMIYCRECGSWVHILSNHLKSHNVGWFEYLEKYNLPENYSPISRKFREKISKARDVYRQNALKKKAERIREITIMEGMVEEKVKKIKKLMQKKKRGK